MSGYRIEPKTIAAGICLTGDTWAWATGVLALGEVSGDRNTILLPITYGIPIRNGSSEILYPFIGGGISIKEIFDDFDIGGLVTAGVDAPVSDRLTGTARFNVGFGDDTDVGLLLGIGYGN